MIASIAKPSPIKVYGALLAVQILFGLNYVISKVVVDSFPPLLWASVRIIIASSVMVLFAILLKRPHPKVSKSFFISLIGFALLGTIINQACFLVGLSYTTSTNSAVLNTLIPVFTLLIVTFRGQERATPARILGFMSALIGVLALRRIEDFRLSDETLVGDLFTIANCLSYAFFLSYGKSFMEKYDRTWATAWLFIYGSFGLTLLAVPDYMSFEWPTMTPLLWWCSAFAILGGTLATYFLNNWALAYVKPSHVALMIYIQPSIAALLAWVWLSTPITSRTVFASLFIFAGLLLAMKKDKIFVKSLS